MPQITETEVCIVGAGAAGGIIAYELARRGIEVVVIDSGPRHDFAKRFAYSQRFVRGANPWRSPLAGLDLHTTSGNTGYSLDWNRARGIGGSTLHWEGYTPRFHASDFRLHSLYGVGLDWPISYDDLEPYYGKAEAALGVAGDDSAPYSSGRSSPYPLPAFAHSYTDALFAKACASLGVSFQKLPQARNSQAHGGRSRCTACGTCHVCPTGAKASTDLTHIPQAEATGKAQVWPETQVLALETDGTRKVVAARLAGPDRRERTLAARTFVVAAGAVETARLLLLSRSSAFPNGLANSSGAVGRTFMSHPMIDVVGRVKENVYPYRVGFSTAISRQFSVERNRSTDGAFALEFLNSAGPKPGAIAIYSGKTGSALRKQIQEEFGHHLGIRIYCEQLPDPANAISLNNQFRDYFGKPVPHIHYGLGDYERKVIQDGKDAATKILKALGASDIQVERSAFAAHQIGTHRMGHDPKSSVVNADLRTHDLHNLYLVGSGCFPTATCTHPTLTISALAMRAAERIASLQAAPQA